MTKAILRILPALALCLPLALMAQNQREPVDSIVALVEEDVILQSELDQAINSIIAQVEARGESLPPRDVLEEQVLERLITQRLQMLRAEATGIRVSDSDVDQALNRVAQQNNMSLSQLRQAVEREGTEFEHFRTEIRNEILVSRLQQRVIESMDEISDTEVEMLMSSDRFGGEEYLLSQIVIGVPESATPEQVRQAEQRVEQVYEQLEEGMSFSEAAISFSQAPDALEGGDVGWRSLSALPQPFVDAIQQLEPGGVSEPLRTPAGFIIMQVRDVRERSEVIVREHRARHLLVSPSELMTTDQARDLIEELHGRIEGGEDFGELAREYSDDQSTANLGGMVDWFPADAYGPYIQEVVESLEPGELSEPFQSPSGWHLLQLLEEREADRTDEVLRAEAREMLSEQKSEEELDRFLRQLRSESFVEIRL